MRCVAVFQDPSEAISFSERLKMQKIKSEIETGDDKKYIVWVIEEDDVQKAFSELKLFQENPILSMPEERDPPEGIEEPNSVDKVELDELRPGRAMREEFNRLKMYNITVQMKSMVTKVLIGFCVFCFMLSSYQLMEMIKTSSPSILMPPITEIEEAFLYDVPLALEWNKELITKFSYQDEKQLQSLGNEAGLLIQKIKDNPPWQGYYEDLMQKQKGESIHSFELFRNIREGEIWRIFTPIFLHANFLHILFNMLWLYVLGRTVEVRLGKARYLALIFIIAAISNTLQYLMSGPFFMGMSGVVCGLVGFIWMRQIMNPLEVYPVQKGSIFFLWVFVLGVFLLQLLAFFLQLFNIAELNLQIANTAHLSGALAGILLARLPFFHRKKL